MIQSRKDLLDYIIQDRIMNGYPRHCSVLESLKGFIHPNIISFLKYLRKLEYYTNVRPRFGAFFRYYYLYRFRITSWKLGYSIGLNSCGPGLSLPHYGTIIISAEAKLGSNCRVHACVNIGTSGGDDKAPIIGDNVYIGPSCVLFGEIRIANNITIGANATVNRSCMEEHVVLAGTPAKVVKKNYPNWIEFNGIQR